MQNEISVHPFELMFYYRPVNRKRKRQSNKLVGFFCSLLVHVGLLTIAGMFLVRPIEFGVDQGLSGMEIQLVAGVPEAVVVPEPVVKEEPVVVPEPPPVIEEKKEIEPIPEEPPPVVEKQEIIPIDKPAEPPPVVEKRELPPKVIEEEKKVEPVKKVKPVVQKANLGNSHVNAVSSGQGAVTEAQPEYLKNPAPKYPFKARQNGWEGTVVLKIVVDPSGVPVKVDIEKSSGHSVLDEAAVQTVKKWQFRPAQLGKIKIESSVRVPITFNLENLKGKTFSKNQNFH